MRTILGCVVGAAFVGAFLSRALGERQWRGARELVGLLFAAIAAAVAGGMLWADC